MRAMIVGQAPSRIMKPGDRPFEGTAALTRLAGYFGVAYRNNLYTLFDFANVISEYPGPQPGNEKYDAFPLDLARQGAAKLREQFHQYDRVLVLGRQTSKAFGWDTVPYCVWFVSPGLSTELAILPHPGGTNMWWNDRENKVQGVEFLRDFLRWLVGDVS